MGTSQQQIELPLMSLEMGMLPNNRLLRAQFANPAPEQANPPRNDVA